MIRSGVKNLGRLFSNGALTNQIENRRTLILFENESLRLLQRAGVSVPKFDAATTENEAHEVAQKLGGKDLIVKAEVPEFVGDANQGTFDSGLRGCLHFVSSPNEAKYIASKIIGLTLRTGANQEEAASAICRQVLIRQRLYARRKAYFGIQLDSEQNGPVISGCKTGIDHDHDPCSVLKFAVDIETGLTRQDSYTMARALDFKQPTIAADLLKQLYGIFVSLDCQLLEIVSLTEDITGKIYCADCNIVLDDDARFRLQDKISANDRRWHTDQSLKFDAQYSDARANIGCIVNGTGLGMASMDSLHLNGGHAAACVEVGSGGGRVDSAEVIRALRSMMTDPKIHAIFVNIFELVSTDDSITNGILRALSEVHLAKVTVPIILRLRGVENSTIANHLNELLNSSSTPIYSCVDFDNAVKLAVLLANNVANQRKMLACQSNPDVDDVTTSSPLLTVRPDNIVHRVVLLT